MPGVFFRFFGPVSKFQAADATNVRRFCFPGANQPGCRWPAVDAHGLKEYTPEPKTPEACLPVLWAISPNGMGGAAPFGRTIKLK